MWPHQQFQSRYAGSIPTGVNPTGADEEELNETPAKALRPQLLGSLMDRMQGVLYYERLNGAICEPHYSWCERPQIRDSHRCVTLCLLYCTTANVSFNS